MIEHDENDRLDGRDSVTPTSERLASDPITGLLQKALDDAPLPKRSLLPKIQQRIHITTRGRYYRDRFSQLQSPVSLLLMAALLIAILAAAVFLVLQPLMEAPEETDLPTPAQDLMAPAPSPHSK
jgi:hypothetical protein